MLAIVFFKDPLVLFLIGLSLLILFFWYFATEIERRKRNVGTVLLFGVVGLCALTIYQAGLKGAIDIVGGSAFTLRIQPKENAKGEKMPVTLEQAEEAMRVIKSRLDQNKEPLVTRQGDDGILVQMPGVTPEESAEVRIILETVAKLELREVNMAGYRPGADGKKTLAQRVLDGEEIVPGYQAYQMTSKDDDGNEFTTPILLNRRTALGGSDIVFATPSQQSPGAVDITLNGDGTDKMIALTQHMKPRDQIAILLDGVVISAPGLKQRGPLGKQFLIDGLDKPGETKQLANALMNPLENPLVVEEERSVSPTLGTAIVKQGIWSGVIGLLITAVFVLIYYRTAGVVALIGLAVNGIILFGVMAMFGFTFSLPGIAGIILTIGLAVDANVLIYERLREEIQNGKSLKSAIAASYDKAFSAIFDANITSLISAVILFAMSSGSIKGFAVTLTIGIVASMFSAILVTRVLFRWGIDTNLLTKLNFLDLIKATNIDFIAAARKTAIVSGALFVISLAAFAVHREDALGIDFTGGSRIQFQLGEKEIKLDDVNKVLDSLVLTRAAFPQLESNPATGNLLSIRTDTTDSEKIVTALRSGIPVLAEPDTDGSGYLIDESKEEVSALIGGTFLKESLIALGLGLIGIGIYITVRFEFAFAVGAFVALLHDIIIAVGIVVLLGRELSLIHVGAILTIAGYSINDTIVIFDRIRETILVRTGAIKDITNEAINATLSRTVLTSATTIVTVAILSLFGGSSLRDFSIMILIGLVIGTYSSVFIASPVVLWWSERKGGNIRKDVLATTLAAEGMKAD